MNLLSRFKNLWGRDPDFTSEELKMLETKTDILVRNRTMQIWFEHFNNYPRFELEQETIKVPRSQQAVIRLPIPVPARHEIQTPEPAPIVPVRQVEIESVATGGNSGGNEPVNLDLFELSSLTETLLWRPVKFTRNKDYPRVVPDACEFKRDSGGFALRSKTPFKYLGYYRREVIKSLEKEYGKRRKTNRS